MSEQHICYTNDNDKVVFRGLYILHVHIASRHQVM